MYMYVLSQYEVTPVDKLSKNLHSSSSNLWIVIFTSIDNWTELSISLYIDLLLLLQYFYYKIYK